MKPPRLHTMSRWPSDPRAALSLAMTDLAFLDALARCGTVPDISMYRIENAALRMIERCEKQLGEAK